MLVRVNGSVMAFKSLGTTLGRKDGWEMTALRGIGGGAVAKEACELSSSMHPPAAHWVTALTHELSEEDTEGVIR